MVIKIALTGTTVLQGQQLHLGAKTQNGFSLNKPICTSLKASNKYKPSTTLATKNVATSIKFLSREQLYLGAESSTTSQDANATFEAKVYYPTTSTIVIASIKRRAKQKGHNENNSKMTRESRLETSPIHRRNCMAYTKT